MKHMIFKWVGIIAWIISACVTINVGLKPFGFNFFQSNFFILNLARFETPIYYIILIAGLCSIGLFVMSLTGFCGCDKCGKSSCGCD